MTNKITLDDALKNKFNLSTEEELGAFAKEVGVKFSAKDNWETKREKLLSSFGQKADNVTSSSDLRPKQIKNTNKGRIVPDYNLSPVGTWEGRRRRITLSPPPGVSREKKRVVSFNGYETEIIYNQPICVPEPIYLLLSDAKYVIPHQEKTINDGAVESVRTYFKEQRVNLFTQDEVDSETAHLCGSLSEWYQKKGPEFIASLNEKDLVVVARELQIPLEKKDLGNMRRLTNDEIREEVYIFLYGDVLINDDLEKDAA